MPSRTPSRKRIVAALLTSGLAVLLLGQLVPAQAQVAAEPVVTAPAPVATASSASVAKPAPPKPKPRAAKHRRARAFLPVEDFGGY